MMKTTKFPTFYKPNKPTHRNKNVYNNSKDSENNSKNNFKNTFVYPETLSIKDKLLKLMEEWGNRTGPCSSILDGKRDAFDPILLLVEKVTNNLSFDSNEISEARKDIARVRSVIFEIEFLRIQIESNTSVGCGITDFNEQLQTLRNVTDNLEIYLNQRYGQ